MARIRTIKPDFWTDEKLTECSPIARLLFIGLLNFADDNGNLTRSSKKIKMQVFPADMIDCEPLIGELITHGVLSEYSVSGEKYLNIKGFTKHQLINRPSKTNIPVMEVTESSLNTHGVLSESSLTERKGEEGSGEEGKGKDKPYSSSASAADPCPHASIIELYHTILPMMPPVREWNAQRQAKLRARWREDSDRQSLDWWKEFFTDVSKSDFLCGRVSGRDGANPFMASLEWLITPNKFAKVIEGHYRSRSPVPMQAKPVDTWAGRDI
jgi:hypothetical protein